MSNKFLDQGKKSRFSAGTHTAILNGKEYKKVTKKGSPNEGKWVYRGAGEEHMTWNELKERVKNPQTGKHPHKPTKGYLAELEDIRTWVKNKGGASKVYLSDVVAEFGDVTDDELVRDTTTETKVEKALGEDKYKKLIKGGERKQIELKKKIKFNKLVRAVNRGDQPLIDLAQSKTGENPSAFKKFLNPVEKRMYEKLSPKFRAVLSRITQPRKKYEAPDIKDISETTTKTFRKMEKKYPVAAATRGDILKSGQSYNDKSYILSQLSRHVGEGGDQYKHISGDTHATAKFRNLKTGKLITLQNIDINDPEFKEAADVYNDWKKIKNTKIDNPLKKRRKNNYS